MGHREFLSARKLATIILLITALFLGACDEPEVVESNTECQGETNTTITNPSFESGTLAGWNPQDIGVPFVPLNTAMAGFSIGGMFTAGPTDGFWVMVAGWDGGGPGTIRISQDITVAKCATVLAFEYRGAWSMGGIADRTFNVNIEPAGGGTPLQTDLIDRATFGTVGDTGIITGGVDVIAIRNQTIRISFELFIPESFTGPGAFQLDNIRTL